MRVEWSNHFRLELSRIEADARGLLARLRRLADLREEDGLDSLDAELDAAESLGLFTEFDNVVLDAMQALAEADPETAVEFVTVRGSRAAQPTLKRLPPQVELTLPPSDLRTLKSTLNVLVGAITDSPARTSSTLAVGLGGSGGCATGECLPEDAPAGPLFEQGAR